MSFHDVRFPSSISFKAEGGPAFLTRISSLKSGKENREILWSSARAEYQIDYNSISKEESKKVLSFFAGRMGKAYAFRFKDWNDFEASNQKLGSGDGVKTKFQLIKTYGDEQNYYERKISKPVESTVKIFVDNVEQNENSDFQLDYTNGILDFSAAVAQNAIVTAQFEFDVPVRFENDVLLIKTDSYTSSTIRNIRLLEVK